MVIGVIGRGEMHVCVCTRLCVFLSPFCPPIIPEGHICIFKGPIRLLTTNWVEITSSEAEGLLEVILLSSRHNAMSLYSVSPFYKSRINGVSKLPNKAMWIGRDRTT